MKKIKVMIINSQDIIRAGVASIIDKNSDLEVIGQFALSMEGIAYAAENTPDVVIIDVKLADASGIDTCRAIKEKKPEIKVIMISAQADEDAIFSSILAGANGFILEDIKENELIKAVTMVGTGESFLDPVITKKVLEKMQNMGNEPIVKEAYLNPQEKRILALIAQGKTNKEIAKALALSDKTVKNYVSSILSKLNFHNRAEAAAYAVRSNILFKYRAAE